MVSARRPGNRASRPRCLPKGDVAKSRKLRAPDANTKQKEHDMIQWNRRNAISRLIAEIERGLVPAIDRHPARFIFLEQLQNADPTKCAVCDVPLIGRQEHFCAGHWDYVVVDVSLDQPYGQMLKSLAAWLRANLSNPRIVHANHYWLGVVKGALRCEVCGLKSSIQEVLASDAEAWVKRHTVCKESA